jgi:3-deoxy-D-manno-octulosonic-acid transferase
MMETESVNLLRACRREGVKTALVNCRISTARIRASSRFFFRHVST